MNSNLDYLIETTLKNGKLQIEYKGKIFKDNPAFVTKNTSKVKVMETLEGFVVELDTKNVEDLKFSINNINNEQIIYKKENKYKDELSKITDLTIIEKMSLWKKMIHCFKKIAMRREKSTQMNIK